MITAWTLVQHVLPVLTPIEDSLVLNSMKNTTIFQKRELFKHMKNTIIVNLFGEPGAGKSTGAAYVFAVLKMNGIDAELATEFAKDKLWEESKAVFENQSYIFGKQSFRLSRCKGKVEVIVTDSPLPLSIIYDGANENDEKHKHFSSYVLVW